MVSPRNIADNGGRALGAPRWAWWSVAVLTAVAVVLLAIVAGPIAKFAIAIFEGIDPEKPPSRLALSLIGAGIAAMPVASIGMPWRLLNRGTYGLALVLALFAPVFALVFAGLVLPPDLINGLVPGGPN